MYSNMRTKSAFVVCAVAFVLFCAATQGIAGTGPSSVWTVEDGIRQEGGWPAVNSILQLSDGSYRSYNADASPYSGYYPVIINSWISADGLAWTKETNLLIGGPSYWAGSPEVIVLPDGRLRMYFENERYPFGTPEWGHILSAISDDGLTWTIEPGVRIEYGGPYDDPRAIGANIFKLDDGRLRMYYSGYDGSHYRILSAVSEDGLAWTKEDGVRVDVGGPDDILHASGSHVMQVPDGRYFMFYFGSSRDWSGCILSAVSSDGLTWEKESGCRIVPQDLQGGPYSLVSPGALVKLSDYEYRMYFAADRYPWIFAGNRIVTLSAVGRITPLDKTPPTLTLSVSPGMLWPPNHKMVTVTPVISVNDNLDAAPQVKLLSITSSELDNGLGDGDTANDIVINADNTISLRAERSGKGGGRVYTITYQATDSAGNSTTASAIVAVPHNK